MTAALFEHETAGLRGDDSVALNGDEHHEDGVPERSVWKWGRPLRHAVMGLPSVVRQVEQVVEEDDLVALGQTPPRPRLRLNRWQSGQRRSPRKRSPHAEHS